ncbi:hypothetical protein PMAYCL1PPCAC_04620, partial [Pristionchus mayeri]
ETNLTRADAIIDEAAARAGLKSDEYVNGCAADTDSFALTAEEKKDLASENLATLIFGSGKLASKEELLKLLEQKAPKASEILKKRQANIENHIAKLDEDTKKFIHNVYDNLLDSIVKLSQTSANSLEDFQGQMTARNEFMKKVFEDYKALPQSSKDAIERAFCLSAAFRIAENGQVEEYVKSLN